MHSMFLSPSVAANRRLQHVLPACQVLQRIGREKRAAYRRRDVLGAAGSRLRRSRRDDRPHRPRAGGARREPHRPELYRRRRRRIERLPHGRALPRTASPTSRFRAASTTGSSSETPGLRRRSAARRRTTSRRRQEIANCQPHLARRARGASDLRVYVALGRVAFDACWRLLAERGVKVSPRPPFEHGAVYRTTAGSVVASYHPSRQNTHTGRLTPVMLRSAFRKARAAANRPS